MNVLIFAGGDSHHGIPYEFFSGKVLIALDGGIKELEKIQMVPQYLLGDFDSLSDSDKKVYGIQRDAKEGDQYQGKQDITIVHTHDQNRTDLEKGILFADSLGATSITICNFMGTRIDHVLGHFLFLKKYYLKERSLILRGEKQSVLYIKDGEFFFLGNKDQKAGIIPFPKAKVSTEGLKYNLRDKDLEIGIAESICNSFEKANVKIKIEGEALFIT